MCKLLLEFPSEIEFYIKILIANLNKATCAIRMCVVSVTVRSFSMRNADSVCRCVVPVKYSHCNRKCVTNK